MASVTYDDRSFMVDGNRIWLMSGSVHYFRTPAGEWKDRLLKAKRSGLNCIDTYVAWNFHELAEGKWDFTGNRDLVAFVRQAKELGLYVILRPGPYICAEWDFGGLPAWLSTKPGIAYRTNNASFSHYFDKYFRQVLPRLAELQVSRGGNIILIQNENEYLMTTMPDRLAYMEFITQLFRRGGFDIPIITCNWQTDPAVPDTIDCVNGWETVPGLKLQRRRQPDVPLLVTEFWDGWFDHWGQEHQTKDAREVTRRALEIIGCGGQINYYMFHGGTNFGFWGSRVVANDHAFLTTSYDYDAPLAEGGGLTPKYYLTRLVNMMANHMGRFLATCSAGRPGASVADGTSVYNLQGPRGDWAIVSGGRQADAKTAKLILGNAQEITVSLELLGATAVPVGLPLTLTHTLDFTNLMPLGYFFDSVLVLHGPAGFAGVVRVNGKDYNVEVPAAQETAFIEIDALKLLVINSELATRTWLVENTLLLGPDFVGEDQEKLVHAAGAKDYALVTAEGKLSRKKIARPSAAAKHPAPKLSAWKPSARCDEVAPDAALTWTKIDRPTDVDALGQHYGYVWYRVEMQVAKAGRKNIYLPECEDRATIYLNGQLLGTWGRGEGATRQPMAANLVKGRNVFAIMVDNMGRVCGGPDLGERKGLWGHMYDAVAFKPAKVKLIKQETFAKRVVPRRLSHLLAELERTPVTLVQVELAMSDASPMHISFSELNHHLAVTCNERTVGFFPKTAFAAGDLTLSSEIHAGKNKLELLLWGDVTAESLKNISFYTLKENLTASAAWSFRPWTVPAAATTKAGPAAPHGGHGHAKSGQSPAWHEATFKRPAAGHAAGAPGADAALFLHLPADRKAKAHASKGQIILNGQNIGRHWSIGPQEYYYLPTSYLTEENHLLIFDESGKAPAHASLEFRPHGPYGEGKP